MGLILFFHRLQILLHLNNDRLQIFKLLDQFLMMALYLNWGASLDQSRNLFEGAEALSLMECPNGTNIFSKKSSINPLLNQIP